MGERAGKLIKVAQQIVEFIYQGKHLPFYEGEMVCICPLSYRNSRENKRCAQPVKMLKKACDIVHDDYRIMYGNEKVVIIAGRNAVIWQEEAGQKLKEWFYITMILEISLRGLKIPHMHISNGDEEKIYRLIDSEERQFCIHESEILYLEAGHNYVLWHCEGHQLETRGSLKEAEQTVSEAFVRIHRSFIVNKNHVVRIARCYVVLDNGEILQIPVKKYCEIKKKLNESYSSSIT